MRRLLNRKNLYIVLGIIVGAVIAVLHSFMFGRSPTNAPSRIISSSFWFWLIFILGCITLGAWTGVNFKRKKPLMPPVWAFVLLLGVITFHWLYWAIAPEVWSDWFHSDSFVPLSLAITLAAFFASQNNKAAKFAAAALGVLCLVAIGTGVLQHRNALDPRNVEITALRAKLDSAERGDKTWDVWISKDSARTILQPVGDSTWFQRQDSVVYSVQADTEPAVKVPLVITSPLRLKANFKIARLRLDSLAQVDSARVQVHQFRANWRTH